MFLSCTSYYAVACSSLRLTAKSLLCEGGLAAAYCSRARVQL